MLAAACCMAFFGFLHCGEFTINGPEYNFQRELLRLKDITIQEDKSSYILHLRTSKTDIFRVGIDIHIAATNSITCPTYHMAEYLSLRFKCGATRNDPLFINSRGEALTREFLIMNTRKILTKMGKNPDLYSGHSFRIGAATTAAKGGVPDHLIKTMGRWASNSYLRYIRSDPETIAQSQRRMCLKS